MPVYRRPADLIEVDLGLFSESLKGRRIRGKVQAQSFVPYDERGVLARELALELGRGDLTVMRSLSRAFVELGEAGEPALHAATIAENEVAARHARATLRLLEDPED